jgi:hypothetical protein
MELKYYLNTACVQQWIEETSIRNSKFQLTFRDNLLGNIGSGRGSNGVSSFALSSPSSTQSKEKTSSGKEKENP